MYTLRKVTIEGIQMNFYLGNHYTLVYKDSEEEFARAYERLKSLDKNGNIYAFLSTEGGTDVYALFKAHENYIMTSNGNTLANVSYRMTHQERVEFVESLREKTPIEGRAGRSKEVLNSQSKFPLSECLAELKWGRPVAAQDYIEKVINHLNNKNPGPGIYEIITETNENAEKGKQKSVFIVEDDDPDNAIIAGYGDSYEDAMYEFIDRMDEHGYKFDENLNVFSIKKS